MFFRTVGLAVLLASASARAEYVLSAPPREDVQTAMKIYSPLAEELTRIMGEPVRFMPAANWIDYGNSMREGKYDFAFDGPHYVGWRIKFAGHTPLVSLPGKLSFVVVAHEGINSMKALRFESVCGLPTPNLATLVMLAQFDPFQSPTVVASRGGFKGVYQSFNAHRCKGAVFRDMFVRNLPEADARKLNVIFHSEGYPEVTLTAGPRVPREKYGAIIAALTQANDPAIKPMLESLGGKKAVTLIPARAETFDGYYRMLEENIWGWQRTTTAH